MEFLTVYETAQILKVAPITIRRYIVGGKLAAVKAGKSVRIKKESIERFTKQIKPKEIGKPLTYNDSLWKIVGFATKAKPTDASRKYEYLNE